MNKIEALKDTLSWLLVESDEPVVLALKAKWGAGKTRFWKDFSKSALDSERVVYISVFGSDTLTDLRQRVVVETLNKPVWLERQWVLYIKRIWNWLYKPFKTISCVLDFIGRLVNHIARKWPAYFRSAFSASDLTALLLEDSLLNADWIICLDDIERLSPSIKIEELLGYVTELKEERGCKVVLIFNEDEFGNNAKKLGDYNEKVIDRNLPFIQDMDHIAESILGDLSIFSDDPNMLKETVRKCHVLDLKNIRLLKKSRNYFLEFAESLPDGGDNEFLADRFSSILLYIWSRFSSGSDSYASLKRIRGYNQVVHMVTREKNDSFDDDNSEDEGSKLYDLLSNYGYAETDELDNILIDFVETDILDLDAIESKYTSFSAENSAKRSEEKFTKVWHDFYHGTLKDNASEFCEALVSVTEDHMEYISLSSLDSVLDTLTKLGDPDNASMLFRVFVSGRGSKLSGDVRGWLMSPLRYPPFKSFLDDLEAREDEDDRELKDVLEDILKQASVYPKDKNYIESMLPQDLARALIEQDIHRITSAMRLMKKYGVSNISRTAQIIAESSKISRMRMISMGLLSEENLEG